MTDHPATDGTTERLRAALVERDRLRFAIRKVRAFIDRDDVTIHGAANGPGWEALAALDHEIAPLLKLKK